ncbi:MAG: cell division protein FtsA [Erysipelotrichales bacterium]|nr:cell division protein FtsA [Erysipelotrichales bacterium]
MKDIYAVLDIGSATIKLVVGEVVSANINILFSRKITSHGIKKGKIENMPAVVSEIKQLLDGASQALGAVITKVALCIPSFHAHIYQSDGITKVNSPSDQITSEDVVRSLKLSKRFERGDDEEIISVIPICFQLDTRTVVDIPIGQKSASLKAESLVITTKKKLLYDYIIAVEKAGVEVLDITIDAYACAKEAFDAVYLQEGAILIDIGYKTSTVSFFEGGYVKYIAQANVGGYDLTKAIANAWQIPMDKAEVYKVKYGTCNQDIGEEDVIHTTKGEDVVIHYTQKDLSIVLNEAVKEIMEVIKTKINVINDGRSYETVIVGGGGELPEIDRVASAVLHGVVRTYRPETIGARDMSYVSCLGMMYYLNDRSKILGGMASSMILPDISSTMSIRFKGLTKTKSIHEGKKKKTLTRVIENFFSEDD